MLHESNASEGEFWLNMSRDESKHATWVQRLKRQADAGEVTFYEDELRAASVAASIKYIREFIEKARNNEMNLIQALARSYDIEKSMIERKVFTLYSADSEEMQNVMIKLEQLTIAHREKMLKMLKAHRKEEGG